MATLIRRFAKTRLLLRAGLINQQYSHIAAFALAAVLGAEIVLPPAAKRDSFAHYFSVFKEQVSPHQTLPRRACLGTSSGTVLHTSLTSCLSHVTSSTI